MENRRRKREQATKKHTFSVKTSTKEEDLSNHQASLSFHETHMMAINKKHHVILPLKEPNDIHTSSLKHNAQLVGHNPTTTKPIKHRPTKHPKSKKKNNEI